MFFSSVASPETVMVSGSMPQSVFATRAPTASWKPTTSRSSLVTKTGRVAWTISTLVWMSDLSNSRPF